MFVYLITKDGLRPFPRSNLNDALSGDTLCPTFAVYWMARLGDFRSFLLIGQFPTYEALCEKASWSISPPSLPPHFERFDGVWQLTSNDRWELVQGEFTEIPHEVNEVLCLSQ